MMANLNCFLKKIKEEIKKDRIITIKYNGEERFGMSNVGYNIMRNYDGRF